MRSKLIRDVMMAQLLTCGWILLKVFLLPYIVWRYFGTSSLAAEIGDLSVLLLGTLAVLTMGIIGYFHAGRYPQDQSPVTVALLAMLYIYSPLFLYLSYKWWFNSAWDTFWSLYLSGWLSIVTHPMMLIGFWGKWVDIVGALLLCCSYLLGVWMYFDESKDYKFRNMRSH